MGSFQANIKHLYNIYTTSAQRLRRWSNIVQMSYKCFMFAAWVFLDKENNMQSRDNRLFFNWCLCVFTVLWSLTSAWRMTLYVCRFGHPDFHPHHCCTPCCSLCGKKCGKDRKWIRKKCWFVDYNIFYLGFRKLNSYYFSLLIERSLNYHFIFFFYIKP